MIPEQGHGPGPSTEENNTHPPRCLWQDDRMFSEPRSNHSDEMTAVGDGWASHTNTGPVPIERSSPVGPTSSLLACQICQSLSRPVGPHLQPCVKVPWMQVARWAGNPQLKRPWRPLFLTSYCPEWITRTLWVTHWWSHTCSASTLC